MQSRSFIGVPPVYTGVVFLLSWIYLLFYAQSAGIEAAAPVSLMSGSYTASAFVMSATLLLIAFLPFDRVRFLALPFMKVATPLLTVSGTLVFVLGGSLAPSLLMVLGGILTGLGSGVMAQQWVMAYRRIGLSVAINSFPMLVAMAVGVCTTLMYLPGEALRVATIAFPVISGVMFHLVRLKPWPQDDLDRGPRDRPLNFFVLLFPFAVFYLASGFLDFFSLVSSYTFIFYALAAFIPLIVSGLSIYRSARSGFMSAFVVPVCFLVVVFVPFFALGSVVPMSQFISIGELGIEVLIFIVAVGFADFFSLDALKTYSLVRAVATFFNSIGWYIAAYAGSAYDVLWNSQASLFVVLIGTEVLTITLAVSIVKAQKDMRSDSGAGGAADGADSPSDDSGEVASDSSIREETANPREGSDSNEGPNASGEAGSDRSTLEDQCDRIAGECNLSRREVDVLKLLARGYSSARIQSELYIAPGTVNYHTRNIYSKLGIHSKQALIDLVRNS